MRILCIKKTTAVSLFESSEEGILLTSDGSARGMEGKVASIFSQLYPETLEEIAYSLCDHRPPDRGKFIALPGDIDSTCKYR